MKKKILGVTLIITLAVVAAFNINLSKSNAKGELALANVEALAQSETGGGSGPCGTYYLDIELFANCYGVDQVVGEYESYTCLGGAYGSCQSGYVYYTTECGSTSQHNESGTSIERKYCPL
jgi:hypothetical protein